MPEIEVTGKIREVWQDGEHYKLGLDRGGLFFVWDKKLWGLLDAFGEAGTEITLVHDGGQYPKVLRIKTIKGLSVKEKAQTPVKEPRGNSLCEVCRAGLEFFCRQENGHVRFVLFIDGCHALVE